MSKDKKLESIKQELDKINSEIQAERAIGMAKIKRLDLQIWFLGLILVILMGCALTVVLHPIVTKLDGMDPICVNTTTTKYILHFEDGLGPGAFVSDNVDRATARLVSLEQQGYQVRSEVIPGECTMMLYGWQK